jgi:hypothetical protein
MSEQEKQVYTHMLRTRVTLAELNMVSNMAAREDITAAQLIRRLIRAHAAKVPASDRLGLANQPTQGMRALKLGVHEAFAKEKPKKKKSAKKNRK